MWPRGRNPVPANSNWKIMKIIGESFLTRPPGVRQHAYEQKGVKIGGEILFESWSPQICTRFFEKYFEGWTGARSGRRSRGACRGGSEQQVLQGRAQATRRTQLLSASAISFAGPENDWSRLASVMRFLPTRPLPLARKPII